MSARPFAVAAAVALMLLALPASASYPDGDAAPAAIDTTAPAADATRDDAPRHPRRHRHDGPAPVPAGVTVPDWDALDADRQRQLAHLRDTWDQMSASRRVRALERLDRQARWQALPPEERERLREGMRNFRDMPPELREKMRASYAAMRALPEAERQRLHARWRAMDPQQRRAWLEAGGPGIAPEPPAR